MHVEEKMRASKYYLGEFSNIAQDRYILGKAFSDEALQRGLPYMLGHLNTWARRAVARETHDHRDPMLIYARQ